MLDVFILVAQLRRPSLLVRSARFGVDDYSRDRHLRRLLGTQRQPRSGEALLRLLEIEAEMDERRLAKSADYGIARHVELLIAIMGEARLLRASSQLYAVT